MNTAPVIRSSPRRPGARNQRASGRGRDQQAEPQHAEHGMHGGSRLKRITSAPAGDELRQEGDVEHADLGIERVGQAAALNQPAPPEADGRTVPPPAARSRRPGLPGGVRARCSTAAARVEQIGGRGDAQHVRRRWTRPAAIRANAAAAPARQPVLMPNPASNARRPPSTAAVRRALSRPGVTVRMAATEKRKQGRRWRSWRGSRIGGRQEGLR